MRGFIDHLAGISFTCLLGAIALRVAFGLVQPMLPLLAVIAVAIGSVAAWRAWQRSRW